MAADPYTPSLNKGKSMMVTVKVYDQYGRPFLDDGAKLQVKKSGAAGSAKIVQALSDGQFKVKFTAGRKGSGGTAKIGAKVSGGKGRSNLVVNAVASVKVVVAAAADDALDQCVAVVKDNCRCSASKKAKKKCINVQAKKKCSGPKKGKKYRVFTGQLLKKFQSGCSKEKK